MSIKQLLLTNASELKAYLFPYQVIFNSYSLYIKCISCAFTFKFQKKHQQKKKRSKNKNKNKTKKASGLLKC